MKVNGFVIYALRLMRIWMLGVSGCQRCRFCNTTVCCTVVSLFIVRTTMEALRDFLIANAFIKIRFRHLSRRIFLHKNELVWRVKRPDLNISRRKRQRGKPGTRGDLNLAPFLALTISRTRKTCHSVKDGFYILHLEFTNGKRFSVYYRVI